MFDTFVMVDWSAANVPRKGRDSIWICWRAPDGERLENPPTRHAAKTLLGDWLTTALARGERVLLGGVGKDDLGQQEKGLEGFTAQLTGKYAKASA